jgi:putative nucleotidyltransferase with HDIG domain
VTSPAEAAAIAEQLLARDLPRRWRHSQGVARAARALADLAGPDAETLEAAAWLHDIGYAPAIAETGFHPLDGARYLRTADACPDVVTLVAHHTNATVEAQERGLLGLQTEFPTDVNQAARLLPLLTHCDLTTSSDGDPVTIDTRLADIYDRYPRGHLVHRSIRRSEGQMRSSVTEVERLRLAVST